MVLLLLFVKKRTDDCRTSLYAICLHICPIDGKAARLFFKKITKKRCEQDTWNKIT
jgi:hypothetical protein